MRWVWRTLLAMIAAVAIAGIGFFLHPVSYFDGWTYLREELAGVKSRDVQVSGHRVHYLEEGPANGPVVVLIHGLGSRAEDWQNLAPYFANAGFHVYMPDLLGYGRSEKPANFSYSVRDEAGVVVGFLDAMGLKQVNLGGWSMGGWIVELIAAGHPERVSRLMLFDAAGLDVKPDWDTGLFTPTTPQQLHELEVLLMPQPPQIPGYVARDLLRHFRKNGWVVKRALATMLASPDVTDNLLPQLKMPVLIEWGALDRIMPVDQAETLHRLIPQSELDVIGGCGHLAPMQCEAQMGPKAVNFLKE